MEHLRGTLAFITAARAGSFTKAARSLELSPQAVAASIARLETALDARLFNRTTRSIALTAEGQAFLAQAEIGLAALENAAQSIRDKTLSPAGIVRGLFQALSECAVRDFDGGSQGRFSARWF